MLEFAENEFELSAKGKDGSSTRDHLNALWKQTGQKPKELDEFILPPTMQYVWELFLQLCDGRQSNGFGAAAFSWSDIQAWINLYGHNMSSLEIKIIKQLDLIAIKDRKNA